MPGGIVLKQGEFVQSATQIQFTVPEDMGDGKVVLVQHENYSIETDKVAMHHDGAEIVIWTGPWICTGWAGNQDLAWGNFDWSTVKSGARDYLFMLNLQILRLVGLALALVQLTVGVIYLL